MIVRFTRIHKVKKPREDWPLRWLYAGKKVNWKGVVDKEKFKAESTSPIWAMMASLYRDGTESETPPFAINSGMGWKDEAGRIIYGGMMDKDEYDEENEVVNDEILTDLINDDVDEITRVGGAFVS